MNEKLNLIGTVMVFLLISLPVNAEIVEPRDAEEKSVRNVVEGLDVVTNAYQLLSPELKDLDDGETDVAIFLPMDKSLQRGDVANMSEEEKEAFVKRHMATGLVSKEPIEFIEWFVTEDGNRVMVSEKDDAVILNDSVSIIEILPAKNGIVYVIDESLAS